ncbi:TVP38/TMEM64 family protein [Dendrosporobacter sp. 1207_IL3150]|uniref:TVP38/TMEM64 family protein n=1 Tax=Dendrosporobacter sp. 1207_IL3150 TaxID=3084054 RepID=UPI002FD89EC9
MYIYGFGLERFKPEAISKLITSLGWWGPIAYVFLNTIRPLCFFPPIILAVAGGLAFGPIFGSIYLILGTVLGAVLCFGLARILGNDKIIQRFPKVLRLEAINAQLETQGLKYMLILRLVPAIPWDAVSFFAGLTKIRFWPYFVGTFLGSVPGALAFCYLGNVMNRSFLTALWGAVIVVVVCICLPHLLSRAVFKNDLSNIYDNHNHIKR